MGKYTFEEIHLNKQYSIKNGAYAAIALNIYSGFLSLFAIEALKATNQQVALLSSLPQIMNLLAMVPGAILVNRLILKKGFTVKVAAIGRFFFLVIALIPFIPNANHAWLLVIAVALMGFPNSLTGLSWQSFIGDLIPREERSRFFGQRNRMNTLAAMLAILTVGIILNQFDKSNPRPFQLFFFLAFLLSVVELYYLNKHIEKKRELPQGDKKKGIHLDFIPEMIREKPYLLFVGSALLFNFGWQMAWPVFSIYTIQYAQATALWVSLFSVAGLISQMISFPYWGKFADKYGNTTLLFLGSLGVATAPILTILSTNLYYLVIINLWSGISVAGVSMLLFNELLNVSPEEGRTTFIAGYNILIGLVGFVAPQVGVWLLELFGMNISMSISAVIRFLGALSFLAIVVFFERKKAEAQRAQ